MQSGKQMQRILLGKKGKLRENLMSPELLAVGTVRYVHTSRYASKFVTTFVRRFFSTGLLSAINSVIATRAL